MKLKVTYRNQGLTDADKEFCELQLRLRDGFLTRKDYKAMLGRSLDVADCEFPGKKDLQDKATRIAGTRVEVAEQNGKMLGRHCQRLGRPYFDIRARHDRAESRSQLEDAMAQGTDAAGGVPLLAKL